MPTLPQTKNFPCPHNTAGEQGKRGGIENWEDLKTSAIAFVPQLDTVRRELTVKELFTYSAKPVFTGGDKTLVGPVKYQQ